LKVFEFDVDQYKWRYYDPQHVRPFIHSDDSSQVSLPHPHQFEVPIRSAPLNPQFLWLTKEHQERLDYCIQLYSSTTNLPADHFELLLGPQEDGSVHSILSLWNEPDPNVPLDYHYLIGFCQVFQIN
jgi:hypothetical protein